LKRKANAWL
jgi:mannose-1-phosphate guanylyltransferase